jgi:hypothetical protein
VVSPSLGIAKVSSAQWLGAFIRENATSTLVVVHERLAVEIIGLGERVKKYFSFLNGCGFEPPQGQLIIFKIFKKYLRIFLQAFN